MNTFISGSVDDTSAIAKEILAQLHQPACVYLNGEMGAGKTTLVQAILAEMGYRGSVTSPTYNLIHEYPTAKALVLHLDLYRIEHPAELEYLGLPELFENTDIQFVEWPNRGSGYLPAASHILSIRRDDTANERRNISLALV